jgi:glycerophosphoryl diester phosphodiesterase
MKDTVPETLENLFYGGHRGLGCTDHEFYNFRNPLELPVENTINSVIAAFEAGVDYVEIDAVMSADAHIFCLHNVLPKDHFFSEKIPLNPLNKINFSEIQAFKTGRNQGGSIPLMHDMLNAINIHDPHTLPWGVNIEIKGVQGSGQHWDGQDFIDALSKSVQSSAFPVHRIMFSSFALQNIIAMSHHLPQAQYAMLTDDKPEPRAIYTDHVSDPNFQYTPLNLANIHRINDEFKKNAHPQSRLTGINPEITTLSPETLKACAQYKLNINSWGLFEKPDSESIKEQKKTQEILKQHGLIYSHITDYANLYNKA